MKDTVVGAKRDLCTRGLSSTQEAPAELARALGHQQISFLFLYFTNLYFEVGLRLELRAPCLRNRCFHLSHTSSPLYFFVISLNSCAGDTL